MGNKGFGVLEILLCILLICGLLALFKVSVSANAPKKTTIEIEVETVLSETDIDLLAKVVHAEAGNQDMIGKRLVADVVLNRYYSDEFPDTIHDVVYQQGQFSTAIYLERIIPTESDYEAVEKELIERIDENVLWFRTTKYHIYGEPLYQHGAHYFSGRKE